MATIEEKLYEAIDGVIMSGKTAYNDLVDEILPIIKEQDRIARQEERERCIKVMQDWYCNNNCICNEKYAKCPMGSVHICDNILLIRKAIEEGNNI